MNEKIKAYLFLHIAVILYGLTAILGALISISAVSLVWWRVLITSLSLLVFVGFGKSIMKMQRLLVLKYTGIGFLIALHWITFYGAIKLSNASVTLAAMATASLFTAVIEPLITGKKFQKSELLQGLLIIPAMLLIANNLDITLMDGLLIGLLSALLAALFATFNKKLVGQANDFQISFIEMASACLFITLILPFVISTDRPLMPLPTDWIYLLILSLGCTTLAFVISLKALRKVSAFDANLVINLEPVYGIILAAWILKDHQALNNNFYIGVLIIFAIVLSHPFINRYKQKAIN